MKELINIAIIGCGRVAGHHIKAIVNNPCLNLSAVSDLNYQKVKLMPLCEKVPYYENYHNMLEKHPEINVVAIITPSGMHFEHALDIISNYKKHVTIEKPVVMTLKQGELLKEAAKKNNVEIFPVHQYRFNSCVQRIKKAITDKELGDISLATVRMRWCRMQNYYDRNLWRGTYAMDGGCCTNQGIHHLDLLRYLNGEVLRVNAIMRTFSLNIEVEDTVLAILEFENSSIGNIEITTAARPMDYESSLSILGSKGLAMLGGAFTDKLIEFSPKPQDIVKYSDSFPDAYGFGHNNIYADVYNKIVNNDTPTIEFSDGMNTIKLLHAIYSSAEQGTWINLNDNHESSKLGVFDEEIAEHYRYKELATN